MKRGDVVPWLDNQVERWDDLAYDRDWPQWAYIPTYGVFNRICGLLRTHEAIDDHCGLSKHRFCWRCRKPMPNAELGRAR